MKDNEIILSRNLEIKTWHIKGSIAIAKSRDDMMLVLEYLNESPKSNAKNLAEDLFFDKHARRVVAQRLLEVAEIYGLTNSEKGQYSLTNDGRKALANKEVLIPEDGIWELSVCNDPLLSHMVIKVNPFKEPNAISELIGKDTQSKLDARKQHMKDLPDWIKGSKGLELIPHAGGQKQRIDLIENKAEKVDSKLSITLEWNVSKGNIRLLSDRKVLNQFGAPKLNQNKVWEILLDNDGLLDDWDRSSNNFAITFEKVDDIARKLMMKNFEFESPRIGDYGEFEDVVIPNIALCAKSKTGAMLWTQWRLDESINTFATSHTYKQWVRDALEPFSEFGLCLPARNQYAKSLWRDFIKGDLKESMKAWYVIAADDWAL